MSNPILAKLMEMVARMLDEGNQPPFIFSMISAHGAIAGQITVENGDVDSEIWTQRINHPKGLGLPVTFSLLDQRGVVTCMQMGEAGEKRIVN